MPEPIAQIGTIALERWSMQAGKRGAKNLGASPLFNLVPPKGMAARFGAMINAGYQRVYRCRVCAAAATMVSMRIR